MNFMELYFIMDHLKTVIIPAWVKGVIVGLNSTMKKLIKNKMMKSQTIKTPIY